MSEVRNVIIAVLIVNSLAIGGILYEIGYFDEDELDISTIVTAKLVIKFKNLGEMTPLLLRVLRPQNRLLMGFYWADRRKVATL